LTTQTFETSLPIKAGDTVALENTNKTDTVGTAPLLPGAGYFSWEPLGEGSVEEPAAFTPEIEVGFNADVQPLPGISSISPSSGPTAGGTSVVIIGNDFAGVSAVKFGSTPATTYTVNSETKITATTPPKTTTSAVNTSVTTPAGMTATSSADRFTYTAPPSSPAVPVLQPLPAKVSCTVPKLTGKKLKVAKKALLKAECKLGKVKGKKSSSAKVKTQKSKPGTVLTAGSKVNVTVK
jgi:hypothetical protein